MIYRIALPVGTPLVNVNDRKLDPVEKAKRIANIRALAEEIARAQEIPAMERVRVQAIYYYPDNRNRDPGNMGLSVKPLIDGGLVDSGIIPNDNDTYLADDGISRIIDDGIDRGEPNVKGGRLVLKVIKAKRVKAEWNQDVKKLFLEGEL